MTAETAAPQTPSPSARRGLLAAPALVWIVMAVAGLLAGSAWALSSSIGSGPDDDFHMPSIWCPMPLASSGCQVQERPNDGPLVWVPEQVGAASICFAFHPELSGACTGALSGDKLIPTGRVNSGDYPPTYYQVMHTFVGKSVLVSVVKMRLFNVALAVAVLSLLAWGLTPAARRMLGWALLGTGIPLGIFLVASVNPSSWWIVGVTSFAVGFDALIRAADRKHRIINAASTLVGATMASVSRADGGLLVILMFGAVALLNVKTLVKRWDAIALGLVAAAFGAWQLLSSSQASKASGSGLGKRMIQVAQDLMATNVLDLPRLWLGIYATPGWGLGWLDTAIPSLAWGSLLVVAGLLVRHGVVHATALQRVVAGLLLAVCIVMPIYLLDKTGDAVGTNYQPRYLLPIFVVMFYLLLRPQDDQERAPFKPMTTTVLFVALAVAHTLALMYNMRRYVSGINGPLIPWSGGSWWWTKGNPGPVLVLFAGTIGIVALTLIATGAHRTIPWHRLIPRRRAVAAPPES